MRSLILFAIPYCIVWSSYGQSVADSVLSNLSKKSTPEKIEHLLSAASFYKMRNLPSAIVCAEKAIELADTLAPNPQLASAYEILGDVSSMNGNFVKGAIYFDKAIQALDHQSDSISLAQKYHTLMYSGGWLTPLLTYDQKIEYGLKSLKIYSNARHYKGMARAHYSLGISFANKAVYEIENDTINDSHWFRQALKHNQHAEDCFRKLKDRDGVADALASQGENEIELGHPEKAMQNLLKAQAIYDSTQNNIGMALVKWQQAIVYKSKGKLQEALTLANQSKQFLLQADYKAIIFEVYDFETEIHLSAHAYKEAFESSLQARKLRDEYYSYQRNVLIAEVQDNYEHKLKNEKIKLLHAENDLKKQSLYKSKIIYWGTTMILIILILALVLFVNQRQKIVRQLRSNAILNNNLQRNLEVQLNSAQLTAARAQMDPHFVFNSINAIQNLILTENKSDAITYLNDFSKLTRQTLDNASKETITIREEINFLNHYIELETLRFNSTFTFNISTEQVDMDYDRIPPMLIQPIVENAIRHGLVPKEEKGYVSVFFRKTDDDTLVVVVDDNGIGRQASHVKKSQGEDAHQSKALQLTALRMQLMSERDAFNKNYPIHIEDKLHQAKATGTTVTITIPLSSISKSIS